MSCGQPSSSTDIAPTTAVQHSSHSSFMSAHSRTAHPQPSFDSTTCWHLLLQSGMVGGSHGLATQVKAAGQQHSAPSSSVTQSTCLHSHSPQFGSSRTGQASSSSHALHGKYSQVGQHLPSTVCSSKYFPFGAALHGLHWVVTASGMKQFKPSCLQM